MELNRNQQLAAIALLALALIGLSVAVAKPSLGRSGFTISEPGKSPERDVDISVEDKPGAANPEASILVHVAGRVRFPNVYRLAPGSRAIDALKAAGGSLPDAYLDAVNLAAKVTDGQQIYIPSRSSKGLPVASAPFRSSASTSAMRVASSSPSSSSGKLKTAGEGFVNINAADSSELQRLPGVGPATAQKIMDYRGQSGRFGSVDALADVKGIGPKKLEKLRPFVTL